MAFRTQKISQMTPKGADLEATDLIEVSTIESGSYVTRSITGQELIDAIPPTTIEWGDIGGTLSDQTDLNTALNAKVPTSRTLTINGVTQDLSADRTFTIATGLTVGTTPIASGTVGRILFEGTGNVVQESSSLFWDDTNAYLNLGATGTFNTARIIFNQPRLSAINGIVWADNVAFPHGFIALDRSSGEFRWSPNSGGYFPTIYSNGSEAMRIATTRNVLIGTTTDAGFRLDVVGNARIQGSTTTSTSLTISGGFVMTEAGNVHTFTAPATNRTIRFITNSQSFSLFPTGNFAINTTTDAGYKLDVNGTARVSGNITQSGFNTASLAFITNGAVGVYSNTPTASTIGLLVGCVSNGGHTAIFTKGNTSGSTAIRITDQNVGASINHFLVDFVGASGFGIANGTTVVNASAQVEIQSTTKGFLPPRMTTTQKNAIATPATGLQVYDTTLNQMSYYNGTTWTNI